MLKNIFIYSLLIIAIAFVMFGFGDVAFAQAPPPPPQTPVQQPITGGLAALALAGGAYAMYKLKKKE